MTVSLLGEEIFFTFHQLNKLKLIEKIREKILSGTHLGTSAGTNICGISIGTTNDMPIVEIESRLSLQILPFNINPHFYEKIMILNTWVKAEKQEFKNSNSINNL